MLRDEIEKITDNLYAGYIDRKPAADKLESLFDDYTEKFDVWKKQNKIVFITIKNTCCYKWKNKLYSFSLLITEFKKTI